MNSFDLIASAANLAWAAANAPAYYSYRRALSDPAAAQQLLLMQYLRKNKDTAFGRAHGFAEIRSPEEFARRVPLGDYDDLQPWIDRVANGEQNVLTHERVTRLVPTSGSTRARKLIPYTAGLQREFNLAIGPWICDLFRSKPGLMCGCAYWSITPALRCFEDQCSKIPIGFDEDSAYLGGLRKRLVDSVMATPPWLRDVESMEAFRYITLLLLLRRRDLRLISVWHPSFLAQLLETMRFHWAKLLKDIETGKCRYESAIPMSVRNSVMARMKALRGRAQELARIGPDEPAKIWPGLKLLSCWADGHSAPAAAQLSRLFPAIDLQPKGLLSTEGVVTIPFADKAPVAVRSHYFEFVDQAGHVRTISELTPCNEYEVVITTSGGLWRYRLRDRVRVTGFLQNTPCLAFVGKEGLISDWFGEKLSEAFVAKALQDVFNRRGMNPPFAMLALDFDGVLHQYTLYLEALDAKGLADEIDLALCENPHYAYCRKLGQLQPLRIYGLAESGFPRYASRLMEQGMKLGDIKPAALSTLEHWSTVFAGEYLSD